MRHFILLLFFCISLVGAALAQTTDDPYTGLRIAELRAREYGAGSLVITDTFERNADFTRYIVNYPSDGYDVYGFMNVPAGEGPFPVVIVVHGYVPPRSYQTLSYTTRYADDLARAGFVVLQPNLRGHFPSAAITDDGLFSRVGYAVDVLNLMGLIQQQGGQPGPLQAADPQHVGLWGHSMGGGIVLRVLTVSNDVDAAVVYGSMSADERLNYERIRDFWTNGQEGNAELATASGTLRQISPIHYLADITAPMQIHHGDADADVPVAWSIDLCERLTALQQAPGCYLYEGQGHILRGDTDRYFQDQVRAFFAEHLR
ncbi:MAG: alpha/beta hydrolase family protein [Anaerolineales bacterium]